MDNGVLVFIIIALGVVVVWQTSKLKQYERFERMLPGQQPERDSVARTDRSASDPVDDRAAAQPTDRSADQVADDAGGADTSQHADHGASPGGGAPTGGAGAEDNIEDAKRVQLVMARCRYAEFYVDQLDDDYEREQFTSIVDDCVATAGKINDPFLEATALQPLILLMDQAGWDERRAALLARVKDDLVRRPDRRRPGRGRPRRLNARESPRPTRSHDAAHNVGKKALAPDYKYCRLGKTAGTRDCLTLKFVSVG